jgi:hypothetical protein
LGRSELTPELKTDLAILLTLWIEFFYDLMWNNHEARLKRRRKSVKKEMDKQGFREGTDVLLQEAKGPVCNMSETTTPVQTTVEPRSQP